jgi:hypothetical protein
MRAHIGERWPFELSFISPNDAFAGC